MRQYQILIFCGLLFVKFIPVGNLQNRLSDQLKGIIGLGKVLHTNSMPVHGQHCVVQCFRIAKDAVMTIEKIQLSVGGYILHFQFEHSRIGSVCREALSDVLFHTGIFFNLPSVFVFIHPQNIGVLWLYIQNLHNQWRSLIAIIAHRIVRSKQHLLLALRILGTIGQLLLGDVKVIGAQQSIDLTI